VREKKKSLRRCWRNTLTNRRGEMEDFGKVIEEFIAGQKQGYQSSFNDGVIAGAMLLLRKWEARNMKIAVDKFKCHEPSIIEKEEFWKEVETWKGERGDICK